jgi:hypothetical protein
MAMIFPNPSALRSVSQFIHGISGRFLISLTLGQKLIRAPWTLRFKNRMTDRHANPSFALGSHPGVSAVYANLKFLLTFNKIKTSFGNVSRIRHQHRHRNRYGSHVGVVLRTCRDHVQGRRLAFRDGSVAWTRHYSRVPQSLRMAGCRSFTGYAEGLRLDCFDSSGLPKEKEKDDRRV